MATSETYEVIRFLHLNLNHAQVASMQLSEDLLNRDIDVASINEPYVYLGKIVGFPKNYDVIYLEDADLHPRSAIIVNRRNKYSVRMATRDVVSVGIEVYGKKLEIVSVYYAPSDEIEDKIRILQGILQLDPNEAKIL